MTAPRSIFWATLELFVAANFWGFGFIATVWALETFSPLWITVWRFLVAFLVSLPFLYFLGRKERSFAAREALLPGLCLAATIIPQTWGLKYTSATKSGFITCLYVVLVPLVERFLLKRALSRWQYLAVFFAIVGTGLIADLRTFDRVNFGDILTLLCAFAATAHILAVGHFAPRVRSPFLFNTFQSLWCGLVALLFALPLEPATFPTFSQRSLIGMGMLTFGSTLFAFMLQVRSQKLLNPTTASMIFLLESPLAAFYAYVFLREHPTLNQWIGGICIVTAAVFSAWIANGASEKGAPATKNN